ncbi:MAG: extracellular solute-binding protein, partial [Ruthenibacterium sp.]
GADHAAMRSIYEDFERQNPDIRLVQDMSPDLSVVIERANDMLVLDRMPDVISTNGGGAFVANAIRKHTALDLRPYLDADPAFAACVPETVLATWTADDGAIYTLPDAREVVGYWYNEQLLRKAGVTDSGTPAPPRTWEELLAACEKLHAASIGTAAMVSHEKEFLLGGALAASGADGLAFMQGKRPACTRETAEAAFALLAQMEHFALAGKYNEADAEQLFFEGKTALYFNGVWANTQLHQTRNHEPIAYAPLPGQDGGTLAYLSSSSGYVIGNTGTPETIDACVRFVKYMLSEPVQQRIVTQTKQAAASPQVTPEWTAQHVPVLGQALAACSGADETILTLSTLLTQADSSALAEYVAQAQPTAGQREKVISIVSDS